MFAGKGYLAMNGDPPGCHLAPVAMPARPMDGAPPGPHPDTNRRAQAGAGSKE
jgi:hypothetical protein